MPMILGYWDIRGVSGIHKGWEDGGGWGNPGQWDWFSQKLPQGLL